MKRRHAGMDDPSTTSQVQLPPISQPVAGPPAKATRDRSIENRRRIEAAALALFTTQGFHGTNNREIAAQAGVSTAAIYLHYSSKEAIFVDLVQKHRAKIGEWFEQSVTGLKDPFSKRDLKLFASMVWSKMREDREYLLLVLIDVIEFKNGHFAEFFHDMPNRLRELLTESLEAVVQRPNWRGHDPAFVLAAIYNYFFHSALLGNYMQGERHLGVADELAIGRFVDLISDGLLSSPSKPPQNQPGHTGPAIARPRVFDQAARERIEIIRLLCGRLWNPPPEILARLSGKKADRPAPKVSILFLPEIGRDRPDDNQLAIEAAALELFTTQGFHGTHIRDIAKRANCSQGTIYTYFPKKELIFESLAHSYQNCMIRFMRQIITSLHDPFSQNDLRLLAWAVRSIVYDDSPYILLMFIDVVEFKNQYFAELFRDLPGRFRHLLGSTLDNMETRPGWCGLDPGLAFTTIYFFFFNYFVIEGHMRGNQHLGAPDDEVIEGLIDLLSSGLWLTEAELAVDTSPGRPIRRPKAPL
jgi:AcrR family transcriptional regulator